MLLKTKSKFISPFALMELSKYNLLIVLLLTAASVVSFSNEASSKNFVRGKRQWYWETPGYMFSPYGDLGGLGFVGYRLYIPYRTYRPYTTYTRFRSYQGYGWEDLTYSGDTYRPHGILFWGGFPRRS